MTQKPEEVEKTVVESPVVEAPATRKVRPALAFFATTPEGASVVRKRQRSGAPEIMGNLA